MDPLPPGKSRVKFMVIMVDYFTKWVETEVLAMITTNNITHILWKNIVYRFDVPLNVILDKGRQFGSDHYRDWCRDLGIRFRYSFLGHPQSNGLVEVTNKTLLQILKKKLSKQKGAWAEELPVVLWVYRVTVMTPTGETPFTLMYGHEAMPLVEVDIPNYRV